MVVSEGYLSVPVPQYQMLGHAVGVAAAQAARREVDVREVDVDRLPLPSG